MYLGLLHLSLSWSDKNVTDCRECLAIQTWRASYHALSVIFSATSIRWMKTWNSTLRLFIVVLWYLLYCCNSLCFCSGACLVEWFWPSVWEFYEIGTLWHLFKTNIILLRWYFQCQCTYCVCIGYSCFGNIETRDDCVQFHEHEDGEMWVC